MRRCGNAGGGITGVPVDDIFPCPSDTEECALDDPSVRVHGFRCFRREFLESQGTFPQ